MKITILGAGIIGISTAYELIKRGFEVTVIDKNGGPGLETSFGNAGLIAPGHAFSWNSPKLFLNLLNPYSNSNLAFKIKLPPTFPLVNWGLKFLINCTQKKFIEYSNAKRELSNYSHHSLKSILKNEDIDFHYNSNGIYYLHRSPKGFEKSKEKIQLFENLINQYSILDKNNLIEKDPFFSDKPFSGTFVYNNDGSGDCKLYTQRLEKICKQLGGKFKYNSEITDFKITKNEIEYIHLNNEKIKSDKFILAFGPFTIKIQKQLKLKIPIYPVKGYSLTIPILNDSNLPKMSGIDEDNFLAFSKFNNNMRITSRAEFSSFDPRINPKTIKDLILLTENIFKDSLDYDSAKPWTGFRAVTPKGTPYICKTKYKNLFLNTGHGHLGWTMASGSAKIISDLIEDKTPQINANPFKL